MFADLFRSDQFADRDLVEPRDRNPFHRWFAPQIGKHGSEDMRGVDVAFAECGEDLEPQRRCRSHQVLEQLQVRSARPLQIVQDQQDRCLTRRFAEQSGSRLEQRVAIDFAFLVALAAWLANPCAQLGDKPGQHAPVRGDMAL